ncbi:hypothetical protein ACFQ8C_10160 [Streptomyces sp. NPDC056503]|uniref:hypothetical protein n=1 Tax=Streptomyces sp. NPDC056503 TaxID=3345842 RepID=UPI0036C9AA11
MHEGLWNIVGSNQQDGDKAEGAVAVALDAFLRVGKTTAALAFAREFHPREIAEHGAFTAQGTSGGRCAGLGRPQRTDAAR